MIAQYREQIAKLAEELNCRLSIDPVFRIAGMMYVEAGYVEVPPIDNQIDYLINLHELGHIYHGHTQGRPPYEDKKFYFENGVLRSEAQAWEFALDHCIDNIEDASRIFMWDFCLGSYYKDGYQLEKGKPNRLMNGNRHYVEFIYDEPDEYFTSIIARIQGSLNNFKIKYEGNKF